MPRWAWISIAVLLYLFVTFFGLGPVLLADGTDSERNWTLFAVIIVYALITAGLVWGMKKSTRRGKA